jgi:hypothetical protein
MDRFQQHGNSRSGWINRHDSDPINVIVVIDNIPRELAQFIESILQWNINPNMGTIASTENLPTKSNLLKDFTYEELVKISSYFLQYALNRRFHWKFYPVVPEDIAKRRRSLCQQFNN